MQKRGLFLAAFLILAARPSRPEPPPPVAAPNFSLTDLRGRAVSLQDYKGKIVLIDFWSIHCAPCVRGIPALVALAEKYGPRGLVVLGISSDIESREAVARLAAEKNIAYPILFEDQNFSTSQDYLQSSAMNDMQKSSKIMPTPAYFLVGVDGKIIWQVIGYSPEIESAMDAEIRSQLVPKTLAAILEFAGGFPVNERERSYSLSRRF